MKFRHPRGVRLALLSGHVTNVGADWVELDPIFHQAALEKGCHCDQETIGDRAGLSLTRGPDASKQIDPPEAIRTAIQLMIEREEEGDFTAAGNPNLNIVSSLVGFKPHKDDVLQVWHAMKAEADKPDGAGSDSAPE